MCACLPLFPAVINSTSLGESADWFKLTLRSIRDRLLSSRSHSWSNPGNASAGNQFYRESVYVTQDASVETHRKAGGPSYSSIELPLRNESGIAVPRAHEIGNNTRVDTYDEFSRGKHPAAGVEVRRDYTIEREGGPK